MKSAFEYEDELAALREELATTKKQAMYKHAALEAKAKALTAAEQRNAELVECAEELADLVESQLDGDYKADSLTTQPIRRALAALKPTESGSSE